MYEPWPLGPTERALSTELAGPGLIWSILCNEDPANTKSHKIHVRRACRISRCDVGEKESQRRWNYNKCYMQVV